MAPGFALILLAVGLAALAPIVLVAALVAVFVDRLRPLALRAIVVGVFGGCLAMSVYALLIVLVARTGTVAPQLEVWLAIFAAGFTCASVTFAAYVTLRTRRARRLSNA